ncbi:DUF2868 domain-containing protein [Desulfobacter hydrogenophilus]|uniref:DUF2868 domain-containing protein n=1 Tax=Desulfobacter hydrogenophilus TaxID=2291 RepID=A0A328FCS0_9BACT|nr:DUF2868 domain-containing protein [Desulfobacter hydrogenophilus]NDY72930.1 DUF2868 domain-containing protein [Desulfobacter hydrogenophilus]QBH12432.1 DUF2868 domain-containing protein [Desulfobacter hydrogenophilus]RAM01520.1 DUF2868 domain-containing protein [Desulfobacter hydrogenophilus]
MILPLKDIIDLDFFRGLDEKPEMVDTRGFASRDREIFRQIKDGDRLDDAGLIAGWLEHRRLLFSQETGKGGPGAKLPGELFASFYAWITKWAFACGLAAGGLGAYSFLAYHGSRPVNVTLFIAVFIFLPALLCLAAALVGFHQFRSGPAGSGWAGALHRLSMRLFIDKFMGRLQKWAAPVQKHFPQLSKDAGDLLHLDTRPFRSILFWPVFIVLSLGALGFSTGALGGTFFRIMVTDMAFGWQSTLLTSGESVHRLVTWMALPWSWVMPDIFVPTLEQIEGSRIVLKEGIVGLASEHLAAWWPFLCMGLLVYALIPRIILVGLARAARTLALARFDLSRPGYQRLLMRMRTPLMGMDIKETGGSRAEFRAPLPRPEPAPVKAKEERSVVMPQPAAILNTSEPKLKPEPEPEPKPAPGLESELKPGPEFRPPILSDETRVKKNTPGALVLGSARGFQENDMEQIRTGLEQQFGIHVTDTVGIHFDFDEDQDQIAAQVKNLGQGPLIVLQEVWQPPIRGLLYYFVQIRECFPDFPLWIVMIQTMDQEEKDVAPSDVNFQVWKSAVNQLNDPLMTIERWVSP